MRRWRSVSFTIRFTLVLTVMGVLVASVPIVLVTEQARAIASDHVLSQVQLLTSILSEERISIQAYAKDVAAQVTHAGTPPTAASLRADLIGDSVAATQGDVIGVASPTLTLFVLDGKPVDRGDVTVSGLAGAAAAHQPTAADGTGQPWITATAPIAGGGAIVIARHIRGDIVPDMVIVRAGVVAEPGLVGGTMVPAGAALDPSLSDVVTNPGAVSVRHGASFDVAVAATDLGGGFSAVVTRSAGGIGNVDPIILVLVALSLIAVLLTISVVQTDLHLPLRRLDRAAAGLADGAFDIPIPTNLGDDAVGRLARTFEITRRRLAITLRASRARAAVATELNTPQPLRTALQFVCQTLRELTEATGVTIVVADSEIGDAFVVVAGASISTDASELLEEPSPLAAAYRRRPGDPVEVTPLRDGREIDTTECVIAVPIGAGRGSLGVVAIVSTDTGLLCDSLDVLTTTADQVALALERYRILSVIERQASTDDMTGLYNHRFMVDYLNQQIAVAERRASPLTVLMLDIDHFKRLNDTHGHQVGDLGLTAFATALKATVRRSDLAARYGGEEFVVIMPDTDAEDACLVAEKIRAAVADIRLDIGSEHPPVRFTVSIGIATYPHNTRVGRDLINCADEALYAAKGLGRNRVARSENHAPEAGPTRASRGKKKEPSPEGEGSL